jgi:hypothetical protein
LPTNRGAVLDERAKSFDDYRVLESGSSSPQLKFTLRVRDTSPASGTPTLMLTL